MKKLLTLAAAGLLCLGAATEVAAYDTYVVQPPVTQLTSGGTYYIYDAHSDDGSATEVTLSGDCRYAFRYDSGAADAEIADVHGTHIKPANVTSELENKHVWTAYQLDNGTWQFQNVVTNRYMANNQPKTTGVEANYGKFDLESTSTPGVFKVKVNGTENTRWDGNENATCTMVYWGGDGHPIGFYAAVADGDGYKLAVADGWNVTYTYPVLDGTDVAFQQTVAVADGEDANAHVPACNYFAATGVTATGENAVVKEGQTSFAVTGQWTYPMEIGKVYRVRLNPFNNDTKSIKLDGENVLTRHSDTNVNGSSFLWYFDVAEHSNGDLKVLMRTIAADGTKGLQFGTGDNSRATLSDTPTALLVQPTNCTNTNITASDFCLKVDGADNWINERNPYFSTWINSASLSGEGSVLRLSALADDDIDAIAALSGCEAEVVAAAKANASQQNIRALFEGVNEYYVQAVKYIDNADAFAALGVAPADAVNAWNAVKEELAITSENADADMLAALLAAYETLVNSSANTAGGAHIKLCPNKAQTDLLGGRLTDGAYVFEYYGPNENPNNTTWTVEAAEGGFNLFNEYSGKYIKFPTHNEQGGTPANSRVLPVVSKDEASLFVFDLFDGLTGRVGIKYVGADADATYCYIHQTGNGCFVVRWNKIAENSSWYLQASDAETAESQANIGADDDVANARDYAALPDNVGPALGQYTIGNRDEYDATLAALNALGNDATNADKHAAAAALRAARAGLELTLNVPLAGHFYRLHGVEGNAGKYLSSTLSDGKLTITDANNADGTNTDNTLATVFYFDGTHLIDMATGMALANGNAHSLVLTADSNAGTVTFVAAPQSGAFNVKSGARYLYNAKTTLDSGDTNENGKVGYAWGVTEVQYLPIPASGEAYSTICLPVDVNRDYRNSMVVLTPEVRNGKVVLTPMNDYVLPANTPFVLCNNGETQDGRLIYLHIVGYPENSVASVTAAKAEGVNYLSLNGDKFSPLEGDVVPGFQYVPQVKVAQDYAFGYNLVTPGKVYTIKNTDIANTRGYLMHQEGEDRLWTSGKAGLSNDAADEAAPANADYHWTPIADEEGNLYLYNLGAKRFAGAYGKLNSAIAEFYWHFSEIPTAFSVDFLDQTPTFNLAEAQLNVLAGDNTIKAETRPAGMTVVNTNPVAPVACSNNGQDRDGCTYFFTEVTGAELPADLPTAASIEAVKATMHANHAAAVENIGNWNEEDAAVNVGYFTAEGFSAFSNAIGAAGDDATAEAKHYACVRARIASEGMVNTFVDGNVYNVRNAAGEYYYAVATEQADGTYETSVATAAALDRENVDFNWLAAVGEDGTVTLSHSFSVYLPVEAAPASRAATKVKTIITHNLVEAAAPVHDGFGNSTLGQDLVVTAVNREDKPETTAIEEISLDERAGADVIYDLQGRRVSRAAKGVYIINGKKTLVK